MLGEAWQDVLVRPCLHNIHNMSSFWFSSITCMIVFICLQFLQVCSFYILLAELHGFICHNVSKYFSALIAKRFDRGATVHKAN